jgi:aminopeptidase-like protein
MMMLEKSPSDCAYEDSDAIGRGMYCLAEELFPLCRSITGNGVRKTFSILARELPDLKVHEVPTGTQCFDWTIPNEWNVTEAYIAKLSGERVLDFRNNNLHLVGYSEPVDQIVSRTELDTHLYSRPDLPEAIPYITSYFRRNWGFCISHNERQLLQEPDYQVKIVSTIEPGSLTYADLIIPGESEEEILISTYVCHPSMGNNESSGIVVAAQLARFVQGMTKRRYTYRFVFVPETIGAVAYISRHLGALKGRVIAGFILTCVGDDRIYSFMPSRKGNSIADRVARHVLEQVMGVNYTAYSFLHRGSDERQYCAPGVDLPVVSVMRSKYGTYSEYHTSLDDMALISPEGLFGGYLANRRCLECLEVNETLKATVLCEPFMSPRGLRPPLVNGVVMSDWSRNVSNLLAYADGEMDLIAMADLFQVPIFELVPIVQKLKECELLISKEN